VVTVSTVSDTTPSGSLIGVGASSCAAPCLSSNRSATADAVRDAELRRSAPRPEMVSSGSEKNSHFGENSAAFRGCFS
jgi:hypothetical protein